MVTHPCALYAWGAAQALLWRKDVGEVSPGAKQRPPGIIVVDSGAFVRGAEHWSVYMQDVLQAVYERTDQRCILVARSGLAFCNDWDPTRTYQYVLQCITACCEAPRFVVWISLGNDLYPPRADMRAYEPGLLGAVGSFLTQAFAYCPQHRFLYGGSSEVWQYAKHFDSGACREYDRLCGIVCGHIRAQRSMYSGLDCSTGARLLHGVELVDRIGHFSAGSMATLRHFYTVLVMWGMTTASPFRSRL